VAGFPLSPSETVTTEYYAILIAAQVVSWSVPEIVPVTAAAQKTLNE
jgi:hypothetical protein